VVVAFRPRATSHARGWLPHFPDIARRSNRSAALRARRPAALRRLCVVRSIESLDFDEIESTPRGKLLCPLCGQAMWGKDALARHLWNIRTVCAQSPDQRTASARRALRASKAQTVPPHIGHRSGAMREAAP
jgi:hypothetical protein